MKASVNLIPLWIGIKFKDFFGCPFFHLTGYVKILTLSKMIVIFFFYNLAEKKLQFSNGFQAHKSPIVHWF